MEETPKKELTEEQIAEEKRKQIKVDRIIGSFWKILPTKPDQFEGSKEEILKKSLEFVKTFTPPDTSEKDINYMASYVSSCILIYLQIKFAFPSQGLILRNNFEFLLHRITIELNQEPIEYKDDIDTKIHYHQCEHGRSLLNDIIKAIMENYPKNREQILIFLESLSRIYNMRGQIASSKLSSHGKEDEKCEVKEKEEE